MNDNNNTSNSTYYVSTNLNEEYIRYPQQFIYNDDYMTHIEFGINGYSMGTPPFLMNFTFLVTAQFPSESNTLLQDNSVLTKEKNGQ